LSCGALESTLLLLGDMNMPTPRPRITCPKYTCHRGEAASSRESHSSPQLMMPRPMEVRVAKFTRSDRYPLTGATTAMVSGSDESTRPVA